MRLQAMGGDGDVVWRTKEQVRGCHASLLPSRHDEAATSSRGHSSKAGEAGSGLPGSWVTIWSRASAGLCCCALRGMTQVYMVSQKIWGGGGVGYHSLCPPTLIYTSSPSRGIFPSISIRQIPSGEIAIQKAIHIWNVDKYCQIAFQLPSSFLFFPD